MVILNNSIKILVVLIVFICLDHGVRASYLEHSRKIGKPDSKVFCEIALKQLIQYHNVTSVSYSDNYLHFYSHDLKRWVSTNNRCTVMKK